MGRRLREGLSSELGKDGKTPFPSFFVFLCFVFITCNQRITKSAEKKKRMVDNRHAESFFP